jgi:SAM-dependent methyltransferase
MKEWFGNMVEDKKNYRRKKLNMGCGTDIKSDYINLDMVPLKGVNVVHDLNKFPYPFEDDTFEEICCINVLEHLPNTVKVMEELYRIGANGCKVYIRVPFWNSYFTYADPTHEKGFHKMQFEFFDITKEAYKNRYYYTKARFKIKQVNYFIYLKRWWLIKNRLSKKILEMLSNSLCNIILLIEIKMEVIK